MDIRVASLRGRTDNCGYLRTQKILSAALVPVGIQDDRLWVAHEWFGSFVVYEALAHLQERNALGRVACLFCGIRAVVCLVQILAPCAHFTVAALFAADVTQIEKSRFHGSALELKGRETE